MEKGGAQSSEVDAPFVSQDSIGQALRHPKTGEMVESKTRWNQINKEHGLRVVGNDWVNSEPKNDVPDRITEEKILEATEKALAIESNPDKRKEKRAQERIELERFMRHQGYNYEVIKEAREIQGMMRNERR